MLTSHSGIRHLNIRGGVAHQFGHKPGILQIHVHAAFLSDEDLENYRGCDDNTCVCLDRIGIQHKLRQELHR